MAIIYTGDFAAHERGEWHACGSCGSPCDCAEPAAECRDCWYCNEERFERQTSEGNPLDQFEPEEG